MPDLLAPEDWLQMQALGGGMPSLPPGATTADLLGLLSQGARAVGHQIAPGLVDPQPSGDMRENAAKLSAQRNRPPDPLEFALNLGGGPAGGTLAMAAAPAARRAAITATNLRDMPLPQAIKAARTEAHVIPSPSRESAFVGAPGTIKSRADLEAMRAQIDEAARLGAEVGGEKWYDKARGAVTELTAGDPVRARLLAQELALTSPQATPETNLGFALNMHNAYEMGQPLDLVRNTRTAQAYNAARGAGTDIPLGAKTGPYAQNIDPTVPYSTVGTNDIWHARSFGYPESTIKGGLKEQQHAFMDAETVLAVDRANRAKFGGRRDWTSPEIQAGTWVGQRAQAQAAEGTPIAEALAQGAKGYPEALQKYTAYGPTDPVPGLGTGHRPDIVAGTPEAAAYGADPRSTFSPEGVDVYHQALGGYQRKTLPTTGIYESPGGPLEVSPGEAARTMVGMAGKSGARTWDPASLEMLRAAEAAKAYVNAQNMAAAVMSVPTNKAGRLGSVEFLTGGKQFTPEQVNQIRELGAKANLPDLAHLGDRAIMTNWMDTPSGAATGQALGKGGLAESLSKIIPGAQPKRTEVLSAYTPEMDFAEAWRKGEGSGAVTGQLRALLSPTAIAKLDASPKIKADVLGRLERDIAGQQGGAQVRADLQNARGIIAKEGFAGLFRALEKGTVALPALLPLLTPYLQQPSSPEGG